MFDPLLTIVKPKLTNNTQFPSPKNKFISHCLAVSARFFLFCLVYCFLILQLGKGKYSSKKDFFLIFSLEKFDVNSPTAESLFKVILLNPENYEKMEPLKSVREDLMYTIKSKKIEDVTCDDNGAYLKPRNAKKLYYVKISGDSVSANCVHKLGDAFVFRSRVGRKYVNEEVSADDVYLLERYYRDSKNFECLKQMVVRVKCLAKHEYKPYMCIVYNYNKVVSSRATMLSEANNQPLNGENERPTMLPHGNASANNDIPYIRTSKDVLDRTDELIEESNTPADIYYSMVNEFNPMESSSQSYEPRNKKQAYNRQYSLKKKSKEVRIIQLTLFLKLQKPCNRSNNERISFSYL